MRIAIAAGGTGGHIYPGIALAQAIKRRDPQATILFLGSDEGLEKELITREGYDLKLIKARALLRKLSYKAVSAPFVSFVGFIQSLIILKNFAADVVVSTGGYASLPVVLAAKLLRLPIVLHEQNVLPGAVNRLSRKMASKCFLSFSQSKKYLQGEVVGNPIRREIILADRATARKKFNLAGEKTVLVMGGSQGAKKINETVLSSLADLPAGVRVLHIIGLRDSGWVNSYLAGKEIKNYEALPYIHDIASALAAADLVISRAGATAIAEFLVRGLPMILIPFPFAAEDHQRLNANVIADGGAAAVVEDKDFTPNKFIALINDNSLNYDTMKQAARALARPEAAERIVDYLYA
ncbi:MAG: undecaprenyldiphospho-muramoylpentapeptide beta-N-acetylglucosaminyltransferase [Candidatus Margulisbacteria bacterium]|nr:undecaprenyldiphospho-muramoylpentapeptide beta-N-acetylglucosaminyltransferase [Candidatus Margulisiibacteriota bacterium]